MNDQGFRIATIGVISLLGLVIFFVRFCGSETVPPLPPAPVTTIQDARQTALDIGSRNDVYEEQIKKDARRFDLSADEMLIAMKAPFPSQTDRTARRLKPGESIDVLGLKLTLSLRALDYRRKQMVLRIDNSSEKVLAYRIVTRPSKGTLSCGKMETTEHNAIVIAPGSIETRTECLHRPGWDLEIGLVEVVEVPKLSLYYLSSMAPAELGLENRVSAGHTAPTGVRRCGSVLPARIKRAQERGEVLWKDLIDFFSRHSCDKYRFPHDYRTFEGAGVIELPAPGSVQ